MRRVLLIALALCSGSCLTPDYVEVSVGNADHWFYKSAGSQTAEFGYGEITLGYYLSER